jgi:hypothetical protein
MSSNGQNLWMKDWSHPNIGLQPFNTTPVLASIRTVMNASLIDTSETLKSHISMTAAYRY